MKAPQRHDSPFPEALEEVLSEQAVSRRELVRRCRKRGWGNVASIHYLANGEEHPTMRAMENIAQALQIPPTYFAEYRLAVARAALDERVVGLEKALLALNGAGKSLVK